MHEKKRPIMPSRDLGDIHSLNELLDRVDDRCGEADEITIAELQDLAGHRATGPLLLVPGLIAVSPLSGIPTIPTLMAVIILIICGQMMLGRRQIWLPQRLAGLGLSCARARKLVSGLRPVARFVDRLTGRRLAFLTRGIGAKLGVLTCLTLALAIPPLEFVPFSTTGAGLIVVVFAMALTAGDGLMMALFFLLSAGGLGLLASLLL